MNIQLISKPNHRKVFTTVTIATLASSTIAYYGMAQLRLFEQPPVVSATPVPARITALGRLEPEKEVIKLSVPATMNNDRIALLLVQRGDRVKAGQVIAILDSHDRLQQALLEAQEQVQVAQSRLAQVRAGAKMGEIAAQQAEMVRLQAELQGERLTRNAEIVRRRSEVANAKAEYHRHQYLAQAGAISASLFDQKRLALETAQAQLQEAQSHKNLRADSIQAQMRQAEARLNQIAEVRPVDVQAAQTDVNRAIAVVKRCQAELNQAVVRASVTGRILEIYTKPGEMVGDRGIADLGQTDQMQVVAEVYQSDISKIRVGQKATITGESFKGQLRGTVREIGLQVSQQEVFSRQPGENLDQRVVKVRIRLHPADSLTVAGLTNLQVQVAIQP
jgi:HlyD family secretion protein